MRLAEVVTALFNSIPSYINLPSGLELAQSGAFLTALLTGSRPQRLSTQYSQKGLQVSFIYENILFVDLNILLQLHCAPVWSPTLCHSPDQNK